MKNEKTHKIIITRYLSLFGMLATIAWFLWNPKDWKFEWEPIVTFIFSLAGFIATDISLQTRISSKTEKIASNAVNIAHKNDAILFRKLMELLPSTGPIDFLRRHDFLIDFKRETLEPFWRFVYDWENVEHEFIDSELEKLRSELYESVEKFRLSIGQYTTPFRGGYQTVRHEFSRHDPEHEKRFREEAKIIDAAAEEVIKAHQKLFRCGREKFDFSENMPKDSMNKDE